MTAAGRASDVLRSPRFFRLWVGWGAIPVAVLSLMVAAAHGWTWGALGAALHAAAWAEAATGLCRRCAHLHCGPHGRLVRRLMGHRRSRLAAGRKWLHLGFDAALLGWWLGWLWSVPALGALATGWAVVAGVAVLPWSVAARADAGKYLPLQRRGGGG